MQHVFNLQWTTWHLNASLINFFPLDCGAGYCTNLFQPWSRWGWLTRVDPCSGPTPSFGFAVLVWMVFSPGAWMRERPVLLVTFALCVHFIFFISSYFVTANFLKWMLCQNVSNPLTICVCLVQKFISVFVFWLLTLSSICHKKTENGNGSDWLGWRVEIGNFHATKSLSRGYVSQKGLMAHFFL